MRKEEIVVIFLGRDVTNGWNFQHNSLFSTCLPHISWISPRKDVPFPSSHVYDTIGNALGAVIKNFPCYLECMLPPYVTFDIVLSKEYIRPEDTKRRKINDLQ